MNIHVGTFISVYISSFLYYFNHCFYVWQQLINELNKRKIEERVLRNNFHLSRKYYVDLL